MVIYTSMTGIICMQYCTYVLITVYRNLNAFFIYFLMFYRYLILFNINTNGGNGNIKMKTSNDSQEE